MDNCICEICGKSFYRRPSQIGSKNFCSSKCFGKFSKGKPKRGGGKIKCTCTYCGKSLYKNKSTVGKNNFCNKTCHNKQLKKISTELNVKCDECGKLFHKTESRLKDRKNNFCSVECHNLYQTGRNRNLTAEQRNKMRQCGPSNACWKGGREKHPYKMVKCPDGFSSMGNYKGMVKEHRLIVAIHLNRILAENEVVHHLDGNTKNNKLTNLALFASQADHASFHLTSKPEPIWSYKICKKD